MVRVPLILPLVVGAKLTLIVQLAPPAREEPQLSVSENCWLVVMPAMESAEAPELVSMTGWGALVVPTCCNGNCREVVESEAVGFGERPVPLNETTRLAPFVPFTVRVPVSGPIGSLAEGIKDTLYVHALPLATPENPFGWLSVGQVVVAEKLPVIWKLVIWKPVEPVLVRLALCGVLDVPIA